MAPSSQGSEPAHPGRFIAVTSPEYVEGMAKSASGKHGWRGATVAEFVDRFPDAAAAVARFHRGALV